MLALTTTQPHKINHSIIMGPIHHLNYNSYHDNTWRPHLWMTLPLGQLSCPTRKLLTLMLHYYNTQTHWFSSGDPWSVTNIPTITACVFKLCAPVCLCLFMKLIIMVCAVLTNCLYTNNDNKLYWKHYLLSTCKILHWVRHLGNVLCSLWWHWKFASLSRPVARCTYLRCWLLAEVFRLSMVF